MTITSTFYIGAKPNQAPANKPNQSPTAKPNQAPLNSELTPVKVD